MELITRNLKLSVIIPARNEQETICGVVQAMKNSKFVNEVIVVDNASTDNTKLLALEYGAKVIACDQVGYGYAVKMGLAQAENDWVLKIDGDIRNPSGDWIAKLVNEAINTNCSLVKCYWDSEEDPMPVTNLLAKPALRKLYPSLENIVMPLSGIYLFNKNDVDYEKLSNDYSLDVNLLVELERANKKIEQLKLETVRDRLKTVSSYKDMSFQVLSYLIDSKDENKYTLMLVMAHPDDAEIWCGGTILMHLKNGGNVVIIIAFSCDQREKEALKTKSFSQKIEVVFFYNEEFSNLVTNENINRLSSLIQKYRPKVLITHHSQDIHADHKSCYMLVSATLIKIDRFLLPKRFYLCNSYFDSADNSALFRKDKFIDISSVSEKKYKLIGNFTSQDVGFWVETSKCIDRVNGIKCGVPSAEAFEICNFYTINNLGESL